MPREEIKRKNISHSFAGSMKLSVTVSICFINYYLSTKCCWFRGYRGKLNQEDYAGVFFCKAAKAVTNLCF